MFSLHCKYLVPRYLQLATEYISMDKSPNGINPKPTGTQDGRVPRTKGKPAVGQATGNSLPKGGQKKVPGTPGSVQGTM